MDQFGLEHTPVLLAQEPQPGAPLRSVPEGTDQGATIHRYGRIAIRADAAPDTDAQPGADRPLTAGETPADLTWVERLGLEAARRRQSPEYLAAKAARPRAGESWDMLDCTGSVEPALRSAPGAQPSPGNDYLEGPVAVGIIIVQGPTPALAFTDAEIANVISEVQNGLSFYVARNPMAGISFSYDVQNVTLGLPADPTLPPGQMEAYWRDPAMQALGFGTGGDGIDNYVNFLRDQAGTRCSYAAYFTKYPLQHFAYSFINGGYLVMDYNNDGWGPSNIDTVFAHETGHVFGCPDEYNPAPSCNATWVSARFQIHNANCEIVAAGGGVPCLMKNNDFTMCDYTPSHLGWDPNLVIRNFGTAAGSWHVDRHPRLTVDLTRDGKADVLGFGDDGVWVSRAIGSGRFEAARFVAADFAYNQGWRVEKHPRFVADVAGTGAPGIVGFGDDGVWYAAGNGDGTFGAAGFVIGDLGYNQGWRVQTHARTVGDITGDRRADIVAFGDAGVWTALSTGTGFAGPNFVLADFGTATGWQASAHPRLIGDITGDGRADIVGFGNAGIYTATSAGDGSFNGVNFVLADFGYDQAWRVEKHPRMLATLTRGRSVQDVVGFGDAGVYIARANGDGTFGAPVLAVAEFGYDQGWRIERHPRFLADTTGDGLLDIVGCADDGIYISRQLADGTFEPPFLAVRNFGYNAGSWRVESHPRFLADVDGNGRADMVGFGDAGVWIEKF